MNDSPTTQRSAGNPNYADLLHRVAVANRFALAAKPVVDELSKNFPRHPMVLAFNEYADVTIDAELREQLRELESCSR